LTRHDLIAKNSFVPDLDLGSKENVIEAVGTLMV